MSKQNSPTNKAKGTTPGTGIVSTATGNTAPGQLERNTQYRRAVEAVIWAMPAVNLDLMFQEMIKLGGSTNQVVYWSRLFDSKNQTLTPNPDVIYLMPFFNTKDVGPIVLEIPPADDGSLTGSIMDAWQMPLEDLGPAGADKGKGGKYLILPPDHKEQVPDGYIVLPSKTYGGYAILRSNPKSGNADDVAKAAAYGKRTKLYPLTKGSEIPDTKFIDAIDVVYDSTIPYDIRFFESLTRFIQAEPWMERDRHMIDQLKSIGIEKEKSFKPDTNMKSVLELAAKEAHNWIEAHYPSFFTVPFYPGQHWAFPLPPDLGEGIQSHYANIDSYPVDARGVLFSFIYFSAKHVGTGQFYLMTINDKSGQEFNGGDTYLLKVPANVPVNLYWSATAYDRHLHSLIKDMPWASRSSITPGLVENADGSTDIFFGPQAPQGKETNWIPTSPDGIFEVLFRFYGPEKPLFDKTWTLPDIEKIN